MPLVDLHCHSTASDGTLAPREVVARAAAAGVDLLALTDHDEISGLAEARRAADDAGLRLLNGVEVSVTWRDQTLHVVGLAIDPGHRALRDGLAGIRAGRVARAERMAAGLAETGIDDALEGACRFVSNPGLIGRTHFARLLVERSVCPDVRSVFRRFLTVGKPGYIPHRWVELSAAVGWIRAAGGVAVLAHPGRYKLSGTGLRELLREFKEVQGAAVEVVTGSHGPAQYARFAQLARDFGLLTSAGSDFHDPVESPMDFGNMPPLPAGTEPVWERMGWI
ncbi:MAG: 3',5'-nucleoside bisphosphate phosphatase [Pseudomonadota bacterium]